MRKNLTENHIFFLLFFALHFSLYRLTSLRQVVCTIVASLFFFLLFQIESFTMFIIFLISFVHQTLLAWRVCEYMYLYMTNYGSLIFIESKIKTNCYWWDESKSFVWFPFCHTIIANHSHQHKCNEVAKWKNFFFSFSSSSVNWL